MNSNLISDASFYNIHVVIKLKYENKKYEQKVDKCILFSFNELLEKYFFYEKINHRGIEAGEQNVCIDTLSSRYMLTRVVYHTSRIAEASIHKAKRRSMANR